MSGRASVREMRLDEIGLRADYFLGAPEDYLHRLGVDPARLPPRQQWYDAYAAELALPDERRQFYAVVWELDGRPVGFSSLDRIEFGEHGFLHLHLLRQEDRRRGLGAGFVRLSAAAYCERFGLARVYSEPNATNVAPNRALQRAGFRYVCSHHTTPGPLNYPQIVTRWVLERGALETGARQPERFTDPSG